MLNIFPHCCPQRGKIIHIVAFNWDFFLHCWQQRGKSALIQFICDFPHCYPQHWWFFHIADHQRIKMISVVAYDVGKKLIGENCSNSNISTNLKTYADLHFNLWSSSLLIAINFNSRTKTSSPAVPTTHRKKKGIYLQRRKWENTCTSGMRIITFSDKNIQ